MSPLLSLSLAQFQVLQAKPKENLQKISIFAHKAKQAGSELLCLPELCTTGLNWQANKTLTSTLPHTLNALCDIAKENEIFLFGSFLHKHPHSPLPNNTAMLISPQGKVLAKYSKMHLFGLLDEDKHLQAGTRPVLVNTKWGKVGLSICYDIRFPELFRYYVQRGAIMILCPLAFPHPRLPHYQVLLKARAIENQLFVVAINQVGREVIANGKEINYFGNSCIVDPWGEYVVQGGIDQEDFLTATVNLALVDEVRSRLPALKDIRFKTICKR